jgi:hypothetical protein
MKGIFALLIFSVFTSVYAQCPDIETIHKAHLKEKSKEKPKFYVSSQSRTGYITSDKTYEMSFVAQPGNDYRLTTKLSEGGSGTISCEIYELANDKKTVNGTDSYKREKKVLAKSSDAESLEFSTDKTRKIFVAVTLTGGDKKKPTCIGVLVEDKKSTKLGL